jgi:hypothetical protein
MIKLCSDCLQKITGDEFEEQGWNTEKIMEGSSHTLMIYISNLVLRGEVARLTESSLEKCKQILEEDEDAL